MVEPGFIAKKACDIDHPPERIKIHPHDVISGRGRAASKHLGNKFLRKLTYTYKKQYKETKDYDRKRRISKLILQQIKCLVPPGRFLKTGEKNEYWVELGHQEMINKISQALREEQRESHKDIVVHEKRIYVNNKANPYLEANVNKLLSKNDSSNAYNEKDSFSIERKSEVDSSCGVKKVQKYFSVGIFSSHNRSSFLACLQKKLSCHTEVNDVIHDMFSIDNSINQSGEQNSNMVEKKEDSETQKSFLYTNDKIVSIELLRPSLPFKKRRIF